jgi:hypothetical protein
MSDTMRAPWRWLQPGILVADHGRRPAVLVCSPAGTLQTCGDDGRIRPLDPHSPIGRLIEAAPKLLERLEEAERLIDFDTEQLGIGDQWRTLIAQVRGSTVAELFGDDPRCGVEVEDDAEQARGLA